jgi:2-oxoglutarate ferredoxin oxidoreductase subunit delta
LAKITIFQQLCKGVNDCGICTFVCPKGLYCASEGMNESGYIPTAHKDETKCVGCLSCMIFCPDFAIVVEKDDDDRTPEEEEINEE